MGKVYVSDEHGGTDTVIDTKTDQRVATIRLGDDVGNTQPLQCYSREPPNQAALVLAGSLIGLARVAQLVPIALAGAVGPEYLDLPSAFWTIRTVDFGFIVPSPCGPASACGEAARGRPGSPTAWPAC